MKKRNSKAKNEQPPTRFDSFILSCKNSKWIFPILVVVVVVVGIASFTDSLGKIRSFLKPNNAVTPTPITTGNNANFNTVNVSGNNSGQIAGGNIFNSTVVTQLQTQQSGVEWLPPELPVGCKIVTVTSAGGTIQNPASWSNWHVIGSTIQEGGVLTVPDSHIHMSARVVSNRFFVDSDITWNAIDTYSISNMAFFGTMPADWDRNSNSNAFEIVGPDGLPVFQEIYALPEHIVVNGLFPKKPGIMLGMFGKHLVSGFPDEVLTNLPNRKPIFRYPSWKYHGVLAN